MLVWLDSAGVAGCLKSAKVILNPGHLETNWTGFLVITMTGEQFWYRMDGSQWCHLPTMHTDSPAEPRITLHKVPTAHSGLTILVVISSWLPLAFPLVTVPNYFLKTTQLCPHFIFLFPQTLHSTKLIQSPSLFPLLFSLCPPCSPSCPLRRRHLFIFPRITTDLPKALVPPPPPFPTLVSCIFNASPVLSTP